MDNEIPVSIISRHDRNLLYFDVCHIDNPDRIDAAYIKVNRAIRLDRDCEISVSVNDYLSDEEAKQLHEQKQTIRGSDNDNRILADVSEAVKMIASDYVENKGIILSNIRYLCNPRLVLSYRQEKIYPRHECIFFEKKLCLSGYAHRIESPWFFSGASDTITFFADNMGNDDIIIHLENSPDAIRQVEDAQRILVHPEKTIDIVPYKFSKFIRLVADSDKRKINCKIWFQTQLRS